MELPLKTLQQIKLEYQRQYNETLSKLQELKSVLDQLSDVSLPKEVVSLKDAQLMGGTSKNPAKARTKKKIGKRGRKSVWGKFVLSRLRSIQKPLTLDELTNHAIVTMKLERSSFDETRVSLRSATYNLQKKDKKVVTLPIKGTREKLVSLSSWVDEKGKLKEQYKNN